MKFQENDSINKEKKNSINISSSNSNIFFFSNTNVIMPKADFENKKSSYESDKICYICGSSFASEFNRDRHIDNIHFKLNLKECPNCKKKYKNINVHIKTCNKKDHKINSFNNSNNFVGFKHFIQSPNDKIVEDKIKLGYIKINEIKNNNFSSNQKDQHVDDYDGIEENKNFIVPDYNDNGTNDLEKLNNNFNKDLLVIENSNSIKINSKNLSENNNITEIIKKNLYDILQKNPYLAIKKYFVLKNFILGFDQYGTVWFGINLANAEAVALKFQNNVKSKDLFNLQIKIMEKLKKHKIFAQLQDTLIFNNKVILVETLLGPDLDKLIKFCRKKVSVFTIYKIGIELLRCLKLIHKSGYVYINLSCKNTRLLFNPVGNNKIINHITLTDFGFCETYVKKDNLHLQKNQPPRSNENMYYSSINALSGGPINRKDDIISLCYLLIDLYKELPWTGINGDSNGKKEIIRKKLEYPPNVLCGNDMKEVLEIFNDANNLDFSDKPNYVKYTKLLCDYVMNEKKICFNDVCFDWEDKIVKIVQENGGVKNIIQNNNEIKQLFDGYPDFYSEQYLNKILMNIGNFK